MNPSGHEPLETHDESREQPAPAGPHASQPLRVLVGGGAMHTGGGATYIVEQLAALSRIRGFELTVYAAHATSDRLRSACAPRTRVIALPRRFPLPLRFAHEQCVLPWRARQFDLVYQPGGFAMFASPRPQAVLNQNAHHFGAGAAFARRSYKLWLRTFLRVQRWVALRSIRRADAFMLASRSLRSEAGADAGEQDSLGVLISPPTPLPEPAPGEVNGFDPTAAPYVLVVANDYLHKDWDGLVETFREHTDLPRLVLVGAFRTKERRHALQQLERRDANEQRVRFLGSITDRREISSLYSHAACLVAHSFLETAPITVLEALANDVPLVASDIGPHHEFGGERTHYYDIGDSDGLAAAIRIAVTEEDQPPDRNPLLERTWADNAAELGDVLRSIARAGNG